MSQGRAVLMDDAAGVEALRGAWTRLAVALGRPAALPEWVLASEDAGAALRVVALFSPDDALAGIMPLVARKRWWGEEMELLGTELAEGFAVMARPGYEASLARAARSLLREREPHLAALRLASVTAAEAWVGQLAAARPATRVVRQSTKEAPYAALDAPSADDWIAGRSKNFRRTLRRAEHRLNSGEVRLAVVERPGDLPRALDDFVRLHRMRWASRGGSAVMTSAVERGIRRAAPLMLSQGHLRLWTISQDGVATGSLLCLTAGSTYTTWLAGLAPEAAVVNRGFLLRVAALRDAYAHGCSRFDLGTGAADFKSRFASGATRVESAVVLEPSWRGRVAGVRSRSGLLAGGAKARVPEPWKLRLRPALRSIRG